MDYTRSSREEQNRILRQHGYHWEKVTQDWLDDNDDFETRPGWHLYASDGREVSVDRAFREIEIGVEATADEIRTAEEEALRVSAVEKELKRIRNQTEQTIRDQGVRPADEQPQGQVVLDTRNIYGGGDWFVIDQDAIWYCQNNGMDGDNWSYNNVRTGGAGAIGWKTPMDESVRNTLQQLHNGSLKQKLLAETPAVVRGYLVQTKLTDMDGEHIYELGKTDHENQVEEILKKQYYILQYEGTDSVDREMIENTEIYHDGQLVGKANRHIPWQIDWNVQ